MLKKLVIPLCCLALLLPVPANAEGFRILSSNSPAYPVDSELSAETRIDLQPNEHLRLEMLSDKKRCTLRGPYHAPPKCPGVLQRLAGLTPATRGETEQAPDIWAVDAGYSGIHCYVTNKPPALWRQYADQAEQLVVHDHQNHTRTRLAWPRGRHRLTWPADMALAETGTYLLQSSLRHTLITLYALPPNLKSASEKTVWMARQGCSRQVERLLAGSAAGKLLEE